MEKQNSTYWSIIREEIKSAEQLEQEILRENYAEETADFIREVFELQSLSSELAGIHQYSTENALSKVTNQIRKSDNQVAVIRRLFKPWMVAASVFLIIGLAGVHQYFFKPANFINNTDQPLAIVLNDFSEVVLAPQSKLEVSRYYGLISRNLQLEGDAFFNVSSNPRKAFRVKTLECDIKVLGTQFYIVENAEGIKVELLEGRLQLEGESGVQQLLVDAGVAIVDRGKITTVDKSSISEYNWFGEPMAFDDKPLTEIIKTINKNYGSEIIKIEPTARMNDCRIHTVVYPGKIGDFINEMEVLFEIKYRKYKGTFVIDEINCNG